MPYGHASMLLLGEGSEATEPYNKYDKIRPHSIRSLHFVQKVRPLSFRPEKFDLFTATLSETNCLKRGCCDLPCSSVGDCRHCSRGRAVLNMTIFRVLLEHCVMQVLSCCNIFGILFANAPPISYFQCKN